MSETEHEHEEAGVVVAEHEEVELPEQTQALVRRTEQALVERSQMSVEDVVAQRQLVKDVMREVMKAEVHYGVIPGTTKPTLYKPGAQVLCSVFRLAPSFPTQRMNVTFHDDGHLTVITTCVVTHATSGLVLAEGLGLCSTRESRYATRNLERTCPECEQPFVKRSKYPPRENDYAGADPSDPPGWYCYKKVGGCGANFPHNDARITEQEVGKQQNPDLADTFNTVVKMAAKRALLDAVLNATGASDVFTQDMEDRAGGESDPYSDGAGVQRQRNEQAVRQEPQVAPARSWAELLDRMSKMIGAAEATEWLGQAQQQFVQGDGPTLFQRCNGVLIELSEVEGDLAFREDVRDLVARVFAARFDGLQLVGPPWSVSPTEEHLPSHEQYVEEQEAAARSADGVEF